MPTSLVETVISLDVGAQEPWPNDVKLFQPYAMEQILLPDNANCLAVQAFLQMCGLPFQIEHRANAEFMSPSGKVPFIKCGAFVVSELEPIVQFVANKGITLTEDLSTEQKSDMRAYMSIIHTVLVNAELYICWCDDRTYNDVTKPRNGSVYPWPLNHFQTWSKKSAIIKKLKLLGWYQKSMENVYEEVENCCQALAERLEGKEYFFGSKPTQLDALLFGHVCSILCTPNCCDLFKNILTTCPSLIAHCKRIQTSFILVNYSPDSQVTSTLCTTTPSTTNNTQSPDSSAAYSDSSTLHDVENIESNEVFIEKPSSEIVDDGGEPRLTGVSASQMFTSNDLFILSNMSSHSTSDNDDDDGTSQDSDETSQKTEITLIVDDDQCCTVKHSDFLEHENLV